MFCCRCVHDAWMTDGTHQTSMKSPLKLNICPTMPLRPVYRSRLTRCNVASQEVTACLAWAPGGDRLPARCFLVAPEKLTALGPILQVCKLDWLRRYGWKNADRSMYSIDLVPSDYTFSDLLRSTWLASDL